jgi:hypothetical protein
MEMPDMRGTQREEQVGPRSLPLLRRPEIPICAGGRGLILKTLSNYNKIFLAAQETRAVKLPPVAPGSVPPNLKKYFLKKKNTPKTTKSAD